MAQWLNIGQVARAAGIPTKTIRYYEQVGVLPAPARSESGYRQYAQRDVHRLLFIRRARTLGLSLTQIQTLSAELNQTSCSDMRPRLLALIRTQAHAVQQQIAELQLLQQLLEQLRHRLLTTPPSDHAEGCQCLDPAMASTEQANAPLPRTHQTTGDELYRPDTVESLTVLNTTACDNGRCGCGGDTAFIQVSPPHAGTDRC